MNDLVSIIVPVYNVESYLSTCIESILNQTYKYIELILIDDGSTDDSSRICDVYSKKDSRIIVVHKMNEGVSIARNIGIQKASGKYIQFVDSDDFISKEMTEKLLKAKCSDNTFTVCNIKLYYNNKNKQYNLIESRSQPNIYSIQQYLSSFLIKYKTSPFIGSPCNKIFEKDIIQNNNIMFQEGRSFAEDFLFNIEYLKYVSYVFVIDEPLYFYRMETFDSLTKVIKPVDYWWLNYKYVYIKYEDLFIYYNLYKEYKTKISGFMEFAVRDCIRKCFRCKRKLTFCEKIQELKYVCRDNLTQELMPVFECKDFYMKIVRLFSQRKRYKLLGIFLITHSYLVDIYKIIRKYR